jgi:hypothetical protein
MEAYMGWNLIYRKLITARREAPFRLAMNLEFQPDMMDSPTPSSEAPCHAFSCAAKFIDGVGRR